MGNIHRLACTSAFQRALKEVVFQIVPSCFDGFLNFINARLLDDAAQCTKLFVFHLGLVHRLCIPSEEVVVILIKAVGVLLNVFLLPFDDDIHTAFKPFFDILAHCLTYFISLIIGLTLQP